MTEREIAERLLAQTHYQLDPEITEIRTLCSGSPVAAADALGSE
jgi:hypothetical protein